MNKIKNLSSMKSKKNVITNFSQYNVEKCGNFLFFRLKLPQKTTEIYSISDNTDEKIMYLSAYLSDNAFFRMVSSCAINKLKGDVESK